MSVRSQEGGRVGKAETTVRVLWFSDVKHQEPNGRRPALTPGACPAGSQRAGVPGTGRHRHTRRRTMHRRRGLALPQGSDWLTKVVARISADPVERLNASRPDEDRRTGPGRSRTTTSLRRQVVAVAGSPCGTSGAEERAPRWFAVRVPETLVAGRRGNCRR